MDIPDYIKEIRSVHFTKAGQASVSAFSDRIVRAADSKMLKYKGVINNRAAYFFKLCHDICREKNIQPDTIAADDLHKALGTNDRMSMMESNNKNPLSSSSCLSDAQEVPKKRISGSSNRDVTQPRFICSCGMKLYYIPCRITSSHIDHEVVSQV